MAALMPAFSVFPLVLGATNPINAVESTQNDSPSFQVRTFHKSTFLTEINQMTVDEIVALEKLTTHTR